MLRPSYNAYYDRHTTRTAADVLSPFPFNLKRDMFRAKNQYDKMEEKKKDDGGFYYGKELAFSTINYSGPVKLKLTFYSTSEGTLHIWTK